MQVSPQKSHEEEEKEVRSINGKPTPGRRSISREQREAIEDREYDTMYDKLLRLADKFERKRVRRESIRDARLRDLSAEGDLTVQEQAEKGQYQCKDGMCMALGDELSPEAIANNIYAADNPDEVFKQNMEDAGLTRGIDRKLRMLAQGMLDRRNRRYRKLQDRRSDLGQREYVGDPGPESVVEGRAVRNPFYDNINAMRARNLDRRTRVLDEKFPLEKANPVIKASF